ncbi:AraC family transcriptional regulator [Microbacterium hydrocarbonoxydans]|uniref:AraC family transcriptional regulator n=1 Tax=Microbacterium hydrocarbonoxydans TaxID=273678 RepID=UPI0020404BCA|nr:AraC family transcriptional regulator [Microbacterium hydrocarbonoxydans]MCM3778696.1 AraC family transcriptional regulator [Microbacterium hydrocarbonoxydans]
MLGYGDPVADAIGLLRPRTVVGPSIRATGEWALRFDSFPHVRIGGLVRGSCWLTLDGQEPVLLREGDTFLMGNPPAYELASSPGADGHAAQAAWDAGADDGVVTVGPQSHDDLYLCAGHIAFDDENAGILTDLLPPLVIVRATDPQGMRLGQLIDLLATEVGIAAAGGPLVENHLAQILLVHMLRAHAAQSARPTGWLSALNSDGIGAAIRAVHADVAHPWSLRELAHISHMSRSAFAASFKEHVGVPPLEYVTQWRMSLARDVLARDSVSISELAWSSGYLSESAFSTAFRRVVGSSPAQFRKAARRSRRADETADTAVGDDTGVQLTDAHDDVDRDEAGFEEVSAAGRHA